jgi:NAD(P)H-nitrite reductase large subunit
MAATQIGHSIHRRSPRNRQLTIINRMNPDDHVCLCFRVSQRKLVNWMKREQPRVASQMSECLGAGTGCRWCVPFLKKLFDQQQAGVAGGAEPNLPVSPEEYAKRRSAYHLSGVRDDAAEQGE